MSSPMTAKQIFLVAFEMSDRAARDAYLSQTCEGNIELRREVEALLKAHDGADRLLDQPRIDARVAAFENQDDAETHPLPFTERPGSQIGPFKLLEQIGEGGMGVVYMAEQQRPVRRKVALKIIKPGMDTKQVIARFEAERQALAMMDHPNIAHVLDAGSTDSRRPYFVMELVRGIPITEYCDKNKLDTRERLRLFMSVCQAVQHAHTKGIIHRDLKPSNVLVTLHDGVPVPKIIDFGVAKATNQQLTERTLFTSFAQMIGTPLYMSPEQAELSGLDIDTRSDIYSLGVLLYELLTGTTPFDRKRIHIAAYDEVRRIIREEEPEKPSTRISSMGVSSASVSAQRATDPKKLKQLLRGELDWIVMKALEKDRTRRYETASGLVAEVNRYLNGEPVEACPPSTVYRMRKFVQRHKARVGVALGFMLLLLTSSTVSWVLYADARRAQNDYREQRDRAVDAERASVANLQLATTEKTRAETETDRADTHAKELKQRLYDYNIIKAAAAHRDQHFVMANKLLDDCLEDQRGWEWRYLRCRTGAQQAYHRPGEVISGFALTRDGKHILVINGQGTVRLVDLTSGIQIWEASTKIANAIGVTLSVDGELAAVAGMLPIKSIEDPVTGILEIFELHTGKIKFEEVNLGEFFSFPVFSPDRRKFAITLGRPNQGTGTVQLRDLGDETVIWSKPALLFASASFDPQGQFVYLIETARSRPEERSPLRCLAIADGREVWSVQRTTASFVGHSPDGREVVGGGAHHSLVTWDARTGEKTHEVPGPNSDISVKVHFSPDGKWAVTVGHTGQMVVWDWAAKRVHRSLGTAATFPFHVQFTGDSKQLAFVSDSTEPLQFQPIDPAPPALPLIGHADVVKDAAFRIGNEQLLSTGHDGTIRFWNVRTGQELKTMVVGARTYTLDYSADGGVVATGGTDGAKLWDESSGKLLQHWKDVGDVWWVKFGNRGGRLVAAGQRGEMKVWDTKEGRELHSSSINASIDGLALSPDGQRAVTLTARGGELIAWDLDHNQRMVIRPGKPGEFACTVEFMPVGMTVAAGIGHAIELWDLNTRQIRATLHGHNAEIRSLVFNKQGSRLFSGDAAGLVNVWNVETGERLLTIQAHEHSAESLALSNDDATLVTCGEDGLVKLWETSDVPADVVEQRRVVQQATTIVNQRFSRSSPLRDVLESLTTDKGLDPQVLSVALAVANARGQSQATQASRGTMRTGVSDALKVRQRLDEARKSLVAMIGSAAGVDFATLNAPSLALTPSEWHTNANRLVDPANSAIGLEELITLLAPLADAPMARHELAYVRGIAHTRLGQWREAETNITLALSLVPEKSPLWHEYAYRLAFLRAYLGQWDQYASLCQKTLTDFADTNDATLAERTSKMCLFPSEFRVDAAQAGALADRAIAMPDVSSKIKPYHWMAKGIADLRRGENAAAVVSLGEAAPALRGSTLASAGLCLAATELYLAIAYKRLGRDDDARQSLTAATQTFEKFPSPNNSLWNDWMNVKVVLPEAQTIVLGKSEQSPDVAKPQ